MRESDKTDKQLIWAEIGKQRVGNALFKGKTIGVVALLTVIFNAGMTYFTKK